MQPLQPLQPLKPLQPLEPLQPLKPLQPLEPLPEQEPPPQLIQLFIEWLQEEQPKEQPALHAAQAKPGIAKIKAIVIKRARTLPARFAAGARADSAGAGGGGGADGGVCIPLPLLKLSILFSTYITPCDKH